MLHFHVKLFLLIGVAGAVAANDDDENRIIFQLHTSRDNPQSHEIMLLPPNDIRPTRWNSSRSTRIYVHGFRGTMDMLERYAEAMLKAGNYNVIIVNWLQGASTINYYTAILNMRIVVDQLVDLINHLVQNGLELKDLLVVGHSLGAHMAGLAGKQMYGGRKIGIIIGLDPALPLFSMDDPKQRLARTDARYVQVIHTNGGVYGIEQPMGHADFFVNGGKQQPGCVIANLLVKYDGCNHGRAQEYYLESLIADMTYVSLQCTSYEEIEEGECTAINVNRTIFMGGDLRPDSDKPRGVFYLETNMIPPFVIRDVKYFTEIHVVNENSEAS